MQATTKYTDLDSGQRETVFFFMLNAYLNARIDTENESDGDEEVNMYMAHLLESLVDGSFYVNHADELAPTSLDVFSKVEDSDSARRKVDVYRTNADHRLVAFGLFDGWGGHRSLYRRSCTPNESYLEEAQRYYGWAALFCTRLPHCSGLGGTLEKIAVHFNTYLDVFNYMGTHYLHLLHRLTPGEVYHLERKAHEAALPRIEEQALDRMLDAYNDWKADPSAANRECLQVECGRYQTLRPEFRPEALGG